MRVSEAEIRHLLIRKKNRRTSASCRLEHLISILFSRWQVTSIWSHDSGEDNLRSRVLSLQSSEQAASTGPTRISQSIRVTRILVLVSSCFLLLNAPAHVFVIASKIYTKMNEPVAVDSLDQQRIDSRNHTEPAGQQLEDSLGIHLLYTAVILTQLLAYASYSVNFFLYSFSGIAFRTSLRQVLRKRFKR